MERKLYRYKDNKLRLKEMKEIVMDGSPSSEMGMPRGTDKVSITENKALSLVENKEIQKLEEDIERVERFLGMVNDRLFLIIELKYFRLDLDNREIARMLSISEATLYKDLKGIRNIKI